MLTILKATRRVAGAPLGAHEWLCELLDLSVLDTMVLQGNESANYVARGAAYQFEKKNRSIFPLNSQRIRVTGHDGVAHIFTLEAVCHTEWVVRTQTTDIKQAESACST